MLPYFNCSKLKLRPLYHHYTTLCYSPPHFMQGPRTMSHIQLQPVDRR